MIVSASIENMLNDHQVTVVTNNAKKEMTIAPKHDGFGSSINGAELLLLSIATCFCNDIYREANKRKISIQGVKVTATGKFGADGEPGTNFQYKAEVKSAASDTEITALIAHVNAIAEIHNTLRKGIDVTLV